MRAEGKFSANPDIVVRAEILDLRLTEMAIEAERLVNAIFEAHLNAVCVEIFDVELVIVCVERELLVDGITPGNPVEIAVYTVFFRIADIDFAAELPDAVTGLKPIIVEVVAFGMFAPDISAERGCRTRVEDAVQRNIATVKIGRAEFREGKIALNREFTGEADFD